MREYGKTLGGGGQWRQRAERPVTEDEPALGTALNTGISEEFYILYSIQGFCCGIHNECVNVDPTFLVASGQNKFINDQKTKGCNIFFVALLYFINYT